MTLTDTERKQIHEIVRFELRREREGICCPDCGDMLLTASEIDREHDPNTMWTCPCGFDAPLREFENAVMSYE